MCLEIPGGANDPLAPPATQALIVVDSLALKKSFYSKSFFFLKTLMKPSFLAPNIFFSYFEIMIQFNDHNFFQIEQNLNYTQYLLIKNGVKS